MLIFDVNLPDGSGFELCKEVRRISKIPILLLTARDMEIDIVRGLDCGADYTVSLHKDTEHEAKDIFAGAEDVSVNSKISRYNDMLNGEKQIQGVLIKEGLGYSS